MRRCNAELEKQSPEAPLRSAASAGAGACLLREANRRAGSGEAPAPPQVLRGSQPASLPTLAPAAAATPPPEVDELRRQLNKSRQRAEAAEREAEGLRAAVDRAHYSATVNRAHYSEQQAEMWRRRAEDADGATAG